MRDSDVLEKNPKITRAALQAIHGHVFGWALSRCDYDHAVAEDLMQQAYVELLSGKARFDGASSLKTFVFSVVQNLASSRYRRLATRLKFAKTRSSPDEQLTDAEPGNNKLLWSAVASLPARQRDVIELVFCRELTVEQASAVMGVSVGTGRAHYDRAKKALKKNLRDYHDEF